MISDAQAIGMQAEAIFRTRLSAPSWIVQAIEHDFGIDFRVEAALAGALQGCDFYVQVKGYRAESRSTSGRVKSFSVRCATVRYWQQKLLPVMLVAVDVDSGQANFLWIDKSMTVPEQATMTLSVPLDRHELIDAKLLASLEPFWRQWTDDVQDANRLAIYRRLLRDTLDVDQMISNTYERLMFARVGESDAATAESRDAAIRMCYVTIAGWLRDTTLYMQAAVGSNAIEQQIKNRLAAARRALDDMSADAGEPRGSGGWGVLIIDLAEAIPMLPRYRDICRDIIDFLVLRV